MIPYCIDGTQEHAWIEQEECTEATTVEVCLSCKAKRITTVRYARSPQHFALAKAPTPAQEARNRLRLLVNGGK